MWEDSIRSQAFCECVRNALREPASVHENDCGALTQDVGSEPIVNLRPHLARRDRSEFIVRDLNCQIHIALMADVDDARFARREELRNLFNGPHGGR
jgi:hypothetical protein